MQFTPELVVALVTAALVIGGQFATARHLSKQVAKLQEKVHGISNDVADVKALRGDLDELKKDVDELDARVFRAIINPRGA